MNDMFNLTLLFVQYCNTFMVDFVRGIPFLAFVDVRIPIPISTWSNPNMLRFSPNGCLAAVSTPEGRVKIWDTPSKTLKHDIGPLREIGCVCFQPDSTRPLVGVGTADNVIIYDCTRGENYVVLVSDVPRSHQSLLVPTHQYLLSQLLLEFPVCVGLSRATGC